MLNFFLMLLLFSVSCCTASKLGGTCMADRNYDPGLHCETCLADGNVRPRCTRIKPSDPKSKGTGLPFNRYSWLTTPNSFAKIGSRSRTGKPVLTLTNQQDSVTAQLNQPARNVLKEIQTFLETNPSEVITIFIEDYVISSRGLTKLFNATGLMKYWFPLSRMPKNGGNWPLLSDMICKNQRLLVFTSKWTKEISEGIPYEWRYIVENQYGNGGMRINSCPNRVESPPMNTMSKSLILMNYFPTTPDFVTACKYNSAPLMRMFNTCHNASGNQWPNYIAVDFYKRSFGGGAAEATDFANAHLTITYVHNI